MSRGPSCSNLPEWVGRVYHRFIIELTAFFRTNASLTGVSGTEKPTTLERSADIKTIQWEERGESQEVAAQ